MKEMIGIKRTRKNGTEGLLVDLPQMEVLQRDSKHQTNWNIFSAYDAEGTWLLRQKLQELLETMDWLGGKNMYDYYQMYMRSFGEVLTDVERRGIRVDLRDYLAGVEVKARKDRERYVAVFRHWAAKQIGPDGLAINTASSLQLCTFLFRGAENAQTKQKTESVRVFNVPREEVPEDALEALRVRDIQVAADTPPDKDDFDVMTAVQLNALCKDLGLKQSGKKAGL